MTTFNVTVLEQPIYTKPKTNAEKKEWAKSLGESPPKTFSIEDLSKAVCEKKFSFCHCTCNPQWIKVENFEQSQLLVLDIDEGLTVKEFFDRSDEFNFPRPSLIYNTLSSKVEVNLSYEEKIRKVKKYRVVFILDQPVRDIEQFHFLLNDGLYKLFPEADRVGAVQKWFPGKEEIYLNEEAVLDPLSLMYSANLYDSKNVTEARMRQKINEFSKNPSQSLFQNGVRSAGTIENEFPKNANPLIIHKGNAENGNGEIGNTKIRNFDWDKALAESKLLQKFSKCKEKIKNPQLYGLYSAMRRIEGGALKWKKWLKKNPTIDNCHLGIKHWYEKVTANGDNPWEQKLLFYAPDDPAALKYERLTDIHFKKSHCARKFKDTTEISLNRAENELEAFIQEAFNERKQNFHVCKAATALGKTRSYINNIRNGCLIAVPSHELKEEIGERCRSSNIKVLIMPQEPNLPDKIYEELEKIGATGDFALRAGKLRHMANDINKILEYGVFGSKAKNFQKRLSEYLSKIEDCKNTSTPVITTHKRILFTDFPNHDTIIIDEDILPTLLEVKSYSTRDLRILKNRVDVAEYEGSEEDLEVLEGLLDDIDSSDLGKVYSYSEKMAINMEEIRGAIYKSKDVIGGTLFPFFTCENYIIQLENIKDTGGEREVYYMNRHKLPDNKKFIVLSATANELLYRNLFGDITWKDISHIEYQGDRIQYSNLSFSKSTIACKNNRNALEEVKELIKDKEVITFIDHKHLFETSSEEIHFGNCSGYDFLAGEDIAVVGTPHVPDYVHKLMAAEIGFECPEEYFELKQRNISHNGFNFIIMTYDHEVLRAIQFYYIESNLTQACGRNRGLRKDASCILVSNYPLPGFEQHSLRELSKSR